MLSIFKFGGAKRLQSFIIRHSSFVIPKGDFLELGIWILFVICHLVLGIFFNQPLNDICNLSGKAIKTVKIRVAKVHPENRCCNIGKNRAVCHPDLQVLLNNASDNFFPRNAKGCRGDPVHAGRPWQLFPRE